MIIDHPPPIHGEQPRHRHPVALERRPRRLGEAGSNLHPISERLLDGHFVEGRQISRRRHPRQHVDGLPVGEDGRLVELKPPHLSLILGAEVEMKLLPGMHHHHGTCPNALEHPPQREHGDQRDRREPGASPGAKPRGCPGTEAQHSSAHRLSEASLEEPGAGEDQGNSGQSVGDGGIGSERPVVRPGVHHEPSQYAGDVGPLALEATGSDEVNQKEGDRRLEDDDLDDARDEMVHARLRFGTVPRMGRQLPPRKASEQP